MQRCTIWRPCLMEGRIRGSFVGGLSSPPLKMWAWRILRRYPLAVACQQAVEFVGMPEGFIPLAEAVVYLALANKSNSAYAAYLAAQKRNTPEWPAARSFAFTQSIHIGCIRSGDTGEDTNILTVIPMPGWSRTICPRSLKDVPFTIPRTRASRRKSPHGGVSSKSAKRPVPGPAFSRKTLSGQA